MPGGGGQGLGCVALDVCTAGAAVPAWSTPSAASRFKETECGEQDTLTLALGAARTWLPCDPVYQALLANTGAPCTHVHFLHVLFRIPCPLPLLFKLESPLPWAWVKAFGLRGHSAWAGTGKGVKKEGK